MRRKREKRKEKDERAYAPLRYSPSEHFMGRVELTARPRASERSMTAPLMM